LRKPRGGVARRTGFQVEGTHERRPDAPLQLHYLHRSLCIQPCNGQSIREAAGASPFLTVIKPHPYGDLTPVRLCLCRDIGPNWHAEVLMFGDILPPVIIYLSIFHL
jgi:hypothetical protein